MSRTYKMKKKIIFVIFGATGDLAKRKLFPSISYLEYEKKLYDIYEVVGVARTKLTQENFKKGCKPVWKSSLKTTCERVFWTSSATLGWTTR